VVSRSALPAVAEPAEIDRLVSASVGGGQPIYRLDTSAIRDLRPDLVLSQDLCAVCAVPSGHINQALDVLGCQAEVVSLDPSSVNEVLECVLQVGNAAGVEQRAHEFIVGLRERLASVQVAVDGLERPRVFALEWGDPPFNGGHWVPEMLQVAGGEPLLACPGCPVGAGDLGADRGYGAAGGGVHALRVWPPGGRRRGEADLAGAARAGRCRGDRRCRRQRLLLPSGPTAGRRGGDPRRGAPPRTAPPTTGGNRRATRAKRAS
jgi:hypothetical protein